MSEEMNVELLPAIKQAAQSGNAKAQFHLGKMYATGDMVAVDYPHAAHWISMACGQGLVEAKPMMAWLYSNGFGVEQNDEKAAFWTRQAANDGVAKCQYALACLYRWGDGGVQPDAKAMLTWYTKAAEQHFAPAMHALGKIMAAGEMVQEDKIGAYQWLSLAVLGGSQKAQETLSGLATRMSKKEREMAQAILTRAADHPEMQKMVKP